MSQQIIFFDLDGTLLTSQNNIKSDVVDCIHKLKEKNIIPVIATGRGLSESKEFLQQCDIDTIVAMNGGLIIKNNKVIDSSVIPTDTCQKLSHILDEEDSLSFFSKDDAWISNHTDLSKLVYSKLNLELPTIDSEAPTRHDILSMMLCTTKEKNELEACCPELDFFKVSPYSYDIVLKNVNKGNSVKKLLQSFDEVTSYAFGDGENDLSLFQACDIGIAMGNATEELKKIADFVTDNNNGDGIKLGLQQYNLI